jgi:iron complex outermembrane receptor protein
MARSLLAAVAPLVLASSALAAAAEPAATPDTAVYLLPFTTIVTASRQGIPLRLNPAATTVVGAHDLATMPRGIAAEEALVGVPGVRIDNQADGERVHVSIRGQGVLTESGIRGIKVLQDGLPLNDPTGVAPDLFDIDWATVDRVEVLRGPAGALYGGGGSGGVINIVTCDGGASPVAGQVSGAYGSHAFHKSLAEVGGTAGNANYRVSLSEAAGDGYRQHTSFWSDHLYGKLRWMPSARVELQQVLAWTDHFEQNAEGLNAAQVQQDPLQPNPDAIPKNEYFKTDRFTTGLTGRFEVTPHQALRFAGYLRGSKYLEPRPSEIIRRQFLTPGLTLQYDLDHDAGAVRNHVSVGADAVWQSVDELRFENLGRARQGDLQSNENTAQQGLGVFGLDRMAFARDWTLMLGARYDAIANTLRDLLDPAASYEKDFDRATGRVGIAWAPWLAFNPYVNWAMGFLPPATAELQNNPAGFGGFNRDLTFATSASEELGARGRLGARLNYELAGFYLETTDDIGRFRLPAPRNGIDFYHNVGDTRRTGVETRLDWNPIGPLTSEIAYTWSHFKYVSPDSIDGNGLPSSPEHMLHLGIDYRVAPPVSVGIETDMQSDWWVDTMGLASVPGFALWGAHASVDWHVGGIRGALTLSARNIFGASYMAFTEPDFDDVTGADVYNSYQPGPKQEYFARITLLRWTPGG